MLRLVRFSLPVFISSAAFFFSALVGSGTARAADSKVGGYVQERHLLELENAKPLLLHRFSGGSPAAEVVIEKQGASGFPRKHLAPPRYEPLVLGVEPSEVSDLYTSCVTGKRLNGSVVSLDFDNRARGELQFKNGLVTEVAFPALDAASKEAAVVQVTITPELILRRKASGEVKTGLDVKSREKRAQSSNFRVQLSGLDAKHVTKMDSFSLRRKAAERAVGERRDLEVAAGGLEVSNLKLFLPESQAQPWQDWLEEFVVKGQNAENKEKTLRLELLAPDLHNTVLALEATGVGICGLRGEAAEGAGDRVRLLSAELYVEELRLAPPGGPPAAPTGAAPAPAPGSVLPLPGGKQVPVAPARPRPNTGR